MFKLLKYELRKTRGLKWGLLLIAAVAEALFLAGLYGEKGDMLGVGVLLLCLLAFTSMLIVGLQSVSTLHRDINTRQSYMLFMTPNSSWRILGAKVLECGLSMLLIGAFFFTLGALDVTLLIERQGLLQQLIQKLNEMLAFMGSWVEMNAASLAAALLWLLTAWLATVMNAAFADITMSALFNGKKFTGLLGVIVFMVMNSVLGWLLNVASPSPETGMPLLILSGVCLLYTAALYAVSAWVMDHKLSV